MSARRQVVAIAVVAALAFVLVVERLDRAMRTPGGPTSSSFATGPTGLAAYADLLAGYGHPIRRVRDAPAEAELDPRSTVVVLDAEGLTRADAEALRSFTRAGGRLLTGGDSPRWLDRLALDVRWSDDGSNRAAPLAPVPEVAGVSAVAAAARGSWRDAGAALPVLGFDDRWLALVAEVGRGRAFLLADASPLQNRLLGRADNAALGLALAGGRGRTVAFLESVHGYGRASGFAAIPDRWRWTLGGLALAAILWMLARGRRLGPAESATRDLPPPRRLYVEALGAVLAKTKSPQAAGALVQAAARERLGEATTADHARLRRAAGRAGLSEEETQALTRPVEKRDDLVAAGRALARIEQRRAARGEA